MKLVKLLYNVERMPTNDVDFIKLLSDIIQKYIVILGPDIVLQKVHSSGKITLDENGIVKSVEGDQKEYFQHLIRNLSEISPATVRKTIEPLLAGNPELLTVLTDSGVQVAQKEVPNTSEEVTSEKPQTA